MCNLSYGIAEKAAERSKLETLYSLVKKGLLTASAAAGEANLTEEDFKIGMDAYYAELASA